MEKKEKNLFNLGLVLGVAGMIAGIGLLFTGSYMIGIFGFVASAALAYKGYRDGRTVKGS